MAIDETEAVKNVREIERALERLSIHEFMELAVWVDERRQELGMSNPSAGQAPIRDHTAFLGSYAPEDEGLYDDAAAR
jgi:hypothetical protein